MANILLRSPYYEAEFQSGAISAKLELSINGNLEYTIIKDTVGGNILFEVSELVSDFIDISFSGTYTSQVGVFSGVITFYAGANGSGAVLGTPTQFNHIGLDGYSTFLEGKNYAIPDETLLQANTKMYVPEGVAGVIPYIDGGEIVYQAFNSSATSATVVTIPVTIKRTCDPKYTPIKVTFLNKYGALQDLWFDKKSVNTYTSTSETFRRNVINLDGSYSTSAHQTYNTNYTATESIVLNTGFVDEGMDEVINQLTLSPKIWGTINSQVIPLSIKTKNQTRKTHLNDKLINYTIEFDYAFDYINNIR
tara:strand:- start:4486 stop:5406 length:921 start_codon:yes stop_codon:yes gene_type:complete